MVVLVYQGNRISQTSISLSILSISSVARSFWDELMTCSKALRLFRNARPEAANAGKRPTNRNNMNMVVLILLAALVDSVVIRVLFGSSKSVGADVRVEI